MIICHSRRYLFVHLHKTGGTSVEAALAPTLAWNDLLLGSTPFGEQCNQHYRARFGLTKHSNISEILALCCNGADLHRYRVVTVVREPLERAVSLFNFVGGVLERLAAPLGLDLAELAARRAELAALHPQLAWPAAEAFLASQGAPADEHGGRHFEAFVQAPALAGARGFQSQSSQLSLGGALVADLCWIRTSQLADATELFSALAGTAVTIGRLNPSPRALVHSSQVSARCRRWLAERFADDYRHFFSGEAQRWRA